MITAPNLMINESDNSMTNPKFADTGPSTITNLLNRYYPEKLIPYLLGYLACTLLSHDS